MDTIQPEPILGAILPASDNAGEEEKKPIKVITETEHEYKRITSIGITRKDKEQSKKKRQMAKASRRRNRRK